MNNNTAPELLTPEETAGLLKIEIRQFNDRVSKRSGFPLPLNRQIMGGIRRWKKDEIIKWIENGGRPL